ncbi:DET1- and DDB1-associated protein 1-like isoform X2 [Clavelina lepadiformis]|uniref:DET1- and DDB1-associated protein 1-like isoform X2 n=1 Tax=Clavelina lepadiformis TaxID=159417 RepID=UPI004041C864
MTNSGCSLKSFPTIDKNNFSKFQPDSADKKPAKKLSLYISTEDNTPEQVIKKDRSNILLRYLYQQLDKKNKSDDASKRKAAEGSLTNEISTSDDEPRRKFARCSNSAPSSNTDDTVESAMENR